MYWKWTEEDDNFVNKSDVGHKYIMVRTTCDGGNNKDLLIFKCEMEAINSNLILGG